MQSWQTLALLVMSVKRGYLYLCRIGLLLVIVGGTEVRL